MNRQVKHGTPIHSQPALCATCRSATIIQGDAESENYTLCDQMPRGYEIVKIKVHRCSGYTDKRQPSIHMMKEIAWSLVTDKVGRQIGFVSPDRARKMAEKDEIEPVRTQPLFNPLTGGEEW